MKSNKNIFLHIGFQKTATSYLQEYIFGNLKDYDYDYFGNKDDILYRKLWDLYFSRCKDVNKVKRSILQHINNKKSNNIIISCEAFIGDFTINFFNQDHFLCVLKEVFPDAKILLCIRKQDDFLESLYLQMLKSYYYNGSFEDFTNFKNGQFSSYLHYSDLLFNNIKLNVLDLNYYYFYKKIIDLFDKKNLLIIPFELLKEDKNLYINEILSFLNTVLMDNTILEKSYVSNPRYSVLSFYLSRIFNRFVYTNNNKGGFLPSEFLANFFYRKRKLKYEIIGNFVYRFRFRRLLSEFIDPLCKKKIKILNDDMKKRILNIHKKSNKKLDNDIKFDLRKYGYF